MDSSPVAAATASGNLLRHSSSSSSSHHFLDLFSSPPPLHSSAADEFNESEVFWNADFALSSDDRVSSFLPPQHSGILAALSDDADCDRKQRIGPILTRETSKAMATSSSSSSSSSSRCIPRPIQNFRDYSQSAPTRKFQPSAPINVPKAMRKERKNTGEIDPTEDEEEEEEEMLPPHEIVARGSGVSPNTTFSVLEGVGRTLKGRDLRRVRNAVLHRTGFLD